MDFLTFTCYNINELIFKLTFYVKDAGNGGSMNNTQGMVVNENFSFSTFKVDSVLDITHDDAGLRREVLRIRGNGDQVTRFAFASGDGLVRLANTGAIEDGNVIGHFLSLTPGRNEEIFEFYKRNGFLFPVSTAQYESFSPDAAWRLLLRFKAAVHLMTALDGSTPTWQNLLAPTLLLLLGDPVTIPARDNAHAYESAVNGAIKTIEKASQLPDIDGSAEAYQKNTYTISDRVYGPTFELDSETYEDISSGSAVEFTLSGCSDLRFRNIVRTYRIAQNLPTEERLIIDFLFHFMMDVGILASADYINGLDFYAEPNFEGMTAELSNALEAVARIVVRDEINHNIKHISPKYDTDKMAPSWEVPDLLSAMYFSLFFMRPGVEVYRECANPNCNVHFLVKTTATRNKYCCPACANATAQRNHRRRKSQRT